MNDYAPKDWLCRPLRVRLWEWINREVRESDAYRVAFWLLVLVLVYAMPWR